MPLNNSPIYNAVIAGVGGFSQQVSVSDPNSADYSNFANEVAEVALAVDATIPPIVGGANQFQISLMTSIAAGVYANRSPKLGSNYSTTASAIAGLFMALTSKLQPSTIGGVGSYFQWHGDMTDLALVGPQPLPPSDVTHIYTVDFNTTDWAFSEAGGGPPRLIYTGSTRRFAVIVNPHFESLIPDGEAHLPFVNLFQNVTIKHHSHASVIIDVPPVLESSMATATILEMETGDYITLQYGADSLNPLAPPDLQTIFFVVVFALT